MHWLLHPSSRWASLIICLRSEVNRRFWDKLTGRDKATEGLNRLRSAAGYPKSFIYDDEQDQLIFTALFKRIKKRTTEPNIKAGHRPSLISTAGQPIPVQGVPPEWSQEERFFYSENHPILVCFGVCRKPSNGVQAHNGKANKACTLKDLDDWLKEEENNRKFLVGTLMVGILSVTLIIIRLSLAGSP
jgi:hypothetical protein